MPLTSKRILKQFRYAMYFDGVDDYVLVPNKPVLSGLNTITVMVFLNLLGSPNVVQTAIAKHRNMEGYREWMIYVYLGKPTWQVVDDIANTFSEATSPSTIPGTAHIAGVYNNRYQALYVNASLVISKTTNIVIRPTNEPINIGRRGDGARYFQGYINHVMLYTRALSSDEIAWNYIYPDNPVRNGLVLWLKADPNNVKDVDGDGRLEWIDLSGYGNHGKIYGATLVQLIKPPTRVLAPARILSPAR